MRATSKPHLSKHDLVPAVEACPVCRSQRKRAQVAPVMRSPEVWYLRCEACGACSTSHMPSTEFLDRYYSAYYNRNGEHVTFAGVDRFAAHLQRILPAEPRSILDFGGGDGSLSVALSKRLQCTLNITVVDRSHAEVRPGVRSVDQITGQYDLVLASAVLEHVPDLHSVLSALFSAINPGGYFYARTPYYLPLRWTNPGMLFPEHMHDLGPAFWDRILDTFGLEGELLRSAPSLVETTLRESPLTTLAAHALKAPARLVRRWPFVGGWEVLLRIMPTTTH